MSEEASTTPAAPPPTPFGAKSAGRIVGVFLGVQIVVAVIVGVAVAVRNIRGGGGPASPDGIQIDPRITLGAAAVGTLLAGVAALHLVRKAFARPGGHEVRAALGWTPATPWACGGAALEGLALVVLFAILSAWLPVRTHAMGALARAAAAGGLARFEWALLAVVLAPPIEELVFRGVLYGGLARAWRPAEAGAVTTAIFVALHATEIGAYWPGWIVLASLGALALRARLRTGSLLPAIALHGSYNLGLVLMVYAAGRT